MVTYLNDYRRRPQTTAHEGERISDRPMNKRARALLLDGLMIEEVADQLAVEYPGLPSSAHYGNPANIELMAINRDKDLKARYAAASANRDRVRLQRARELLGELRRRGVEVVIRGDNIRIQEIDPTASIERLPDNLKTAISEYSRELWGLVEAQQTQSDVADI